MQFHLSAAQENLREQVRRVLDERFSTTRLREAEGSDHGFPQDLWDAGVHQGWAAHAGHSLLDTCVLLEEVGRSGVTLPLVTSAGVATTILRHSPPGPVRDTALQAIAAGGIIAPALIDEHGRNEFDAVRLPLTAAGDGYTVSGAKVFVPFASAATELLVTVVTSSGDTAIALVDTAADGVSISRHQTKVGVPLSSVGFDEVSVPADRLLIQGEAADAALRAGLDVGSLLSTAEAVGMSEALIAMTAAYVTGRRAFDRPIGAFQAVAHPCADMRISADAIRILVQQAAWLVDSEMGADEEIPATKALANEHFQRLANDAFRLHGALAFSNECDVQLYMRRLQGFFTTFGETQESYERAAAALGMR